MWCVQTGDNNKYRRIRILLILDKRKKNFYYKELISEEEAGIYRLESK